MPVFPELRKQRREDQKYKANLDHMRPYGKQRKRDTNRPGWGTLGIPSRGKWKHKIRSLGPLLATSWFWECPGLPCLIRQKRKTETNEEEREGGVERGKKRRGKAAQSFATVIKILKIISWWIKRRIKESQSSCFSSQNCTSKWKYLKAFLKIGIILDRKGSLSPT